ncbi:MAG: hypothetical protein CBD74_09625, partial [Saprospirales bacterium TMED214]
PPPNGSAPAAGAAPPPNGSTPPAAGAAPAAAALGLSSNGSFIAPARASSAILVGAGCPPTLEANGFAAAGGVGGGVTGRDGTRLGGLTAAEFSGVA